MNENKVVFNSIHEYILHFPEDIQLILHELRQVIKNTAPEAEEKISYQMPTFYLHGNLVHFAAEECRRMEAALRAVSVENEPNPAKIDWKC